MSSANEVLFSFSLCNPNTSEGYWLWNFHLLESKWIQSIVKALKPIMGIEIESQVTTMKYLLNSLNAFLSIDILIPFCSD